MQTHIAPFQIGHFRKHIILMKLTALECFLHSSLEIISRAYNILLILFNDRSSCSEGGTLLSFGTKFKFSRVISLEQNTCMYELGFVPKEKFTSLLYGHTQYNISIGMGHFESSTFVPLKGYLPPTVQIKRADYFVRHIIPFLPVYIVRKSFYS